MSINTDYPISGNVSTSGYIQTVGGYCHSCSQYWYGHHVCDGPAYAEWTKALKSLQSGTMTVTTTSGARVSYSGNKPIVVCNGQAVEVKDLDEAQSKAEQLAHQHQADAFILKPVKKIAPKREVVTTELA